MIQFIYSSVENLGVSKFFKTFFMYLYIYF